MSQRYPYLFGIAIVLLGLSGCERDNYTTWNCSSQTEAKISMIAKKAQMTFQDIKLDYCGSLGNQSFFDQRCPANIQESSHLFTPSTGLLIANGQEYNCKAL